MTLNRRSTDYVSARMLRKQQRNKLGSEINKAIDTSEEKMNLMVYYLWLDESACIIYVYPSRR